MNEDRWVLWGFLGLFTFIAISVFLIMRDEAEHPLVCVQSKTVDSILSVQYRSATIKFTDGTTEEVSQATLKPGNKWCVQYVRKD
jgi:hypothetical protein